MSNERQKLSWYTRIVGNGFHISAFLLFALSLAVPSGYSYGASGLLLCAIAGLGALRHGGHQGVSWPLVAIVLVMGLLWGMSFDGWWSWSGSDYWLKYWLAAFSLLVISRWGVSRTSVEWGIAAGGVGALGVALYQCKFLGMPKASGFTNAIQFGDLAMYLGFAAWCLAWFGGRSAKQAFWLWLCGACGVLGSLLSETRGAWVVAPLLMACVLWMLCQQGRIKVAVVSVFAVAGLVAVMAIPYGNKLMQRADLAVTELNSYMADPQKAAETSIGQRMEQWRLALRMGAEKPWLGWGKQGTIDGKRAFVEQGLAHPSVMQYGHAHNEILDMWVKCGLVGVFVLLLFYAIPLAVFWPTQRRLGRVPVDRRQAAMALRLTASLLPLAYFGFGWTQVFFAHNSGNMFYVFGLAVFYGAVRAWEAPAQMHAAQPR